MNFNNNKVQNDNKSLLDIISIQLKHYDEYNNNKINLLEK